METIPEWPRVAPSFEWDGSWRDLYIFRTTSHDWNKLLHFIASGSYAAELFVGGEAIYGIWPTADDMIVQYDRPLAHLKFQVGGIGLKCHFFELDQIEFDLDPREVGSAAAWRELCVFMIDIAVNLEKPCFLTYENMPKSIIAIASNDKVQLPTAT